MKSATNPLLHKTTKLLAGLSGLILFIVIFVPIWKIELTAPQYPEGLELFIHANKVSGQVDIINGLNHYIGMREIHEQDFVEFTVLPYILAGIALLGLAVPFINRKWYFYSWSALFILFGILSMVDFYLWLYDYGHNLNPHAAIKVPGMTYQPPLIGFKQLLNFGAYSIPAIGGWIMASSGLLIAIGLYIEIIFSRKKS